MFPICRFTINSQSGEISTLGFLDYETQSQYVLNVVASDSTQIDRRTGTTSVTINVRDVQDQVPLFVDTQVSTTVNENANVGTFIVSLTVSGCA